MGNTGWKKEASRRLRRRFLYALVALVVLSAGTPHLLASYRVSGDSMQPSLHDGDRVLATQAPLLPLVGGIHRGDVVIFRHAGRRFIKRVTAIPGDHVQVEGSDIRLHSDEFFVMGDNRELSLDSRTFGPVKAEEIVAKVFVRLR